VDSALQPVEVDGKPIAASWPQWLPHCHRALVDSTGFLPKPAAAELVLDVVFDRNITDDIAYDVSWDVPGYMDWKFDRSAARLYMVDPTSDGNALWEFRGLYSEVFNELMGRVGMCFTPAMGRFFFAMSTKVVTPTQRRRASVISPDDPMIVNCTLMFFWEMVDQIVAHLQFVSLDGAVGFFSRCKISVPESMVKQIFAACPDAVFVRRCDGVKSFPDVVQRIPGALSGGLWKEAAQVLVTDSLNIPIDEDTFEELFLKCGGSKGYITPVETYDMIVSLGKPGVSLVAFKQLLEDMNIKIDDVQSLKLYMTMDVNQDGHIGVHELADGIIEMSTQLLPTIVLSKLGLTTDNIVIAVAGAIFVLGLLFIFLFVAFAAFTSPATAGAALQSTVTSVAMGVAKMGSDDGQFEKLKPKVHDQIFEVMDVPKHERPPNEEEKEE